MIEKEILSKGVQYLSSETEPEKITVALSPKGEKLYRQILTQRPLYVEKDGLTYEFKCTPFQAENYFFDSGMMQ